jgi:hypothetical protein
MLIGYLRIRLVDSIRYDIYKVNSNIFIIINNNKININLPNEFNNQNIDMILSMHETYEDFINDKSNDFPYIYMLMVKK